MHDLGTIIALNKKAQDKFDGKRKDDDKPQGGTGGITLHLADGRSQRISAIRLSGLTDQDREKQGLMPIEREGPISVRIPQ
ncbi:MAG: hypothetical protein ABGY10_02840 [bacterium]